MHEFELLRPTLSAARDEITFRLLLVHRSFLRRTFKVLRASSRTCQSAALTVFVCNSRSRTLIAILASWIRSDSLSGRVSRRAALYFSIQSCSCSIICHSPFCCRPREKDSDEHSADLTCMHRFGLSYSMSRSTIYHFCY